MPSSRGTPLRPGGNLHRQGLPEVKAITTQLGVGSRASRGSCVDGESLSLSSLTLEFRRNLIEPEPPNHWIGYLRPLWPGHMPEGWIRDMRIRLSRHQQYKTDIHLYVNATISKDRSKVGVFGWNAGLPCSGHSAAAAVPRESGAGIG